MIEKLLEIHNLKFSFFHEEGKLQVLRGFDMTLNRGEIVGILGESGSGKTVSASSIVKLIDPEIGEIDDGEVIFEDRDLLKLTEGQLRVIRGNRISYVFQNPTATLNPYRRIGHQLERVLKNHKVPEDKAYILEALKEVGIQDPDMVYSMYPYQLSGGQNQRIMIAQGMLCKPDILIADEPTSAIDASIQKKILDLLRHMNQKYAMSILLITHDFEVVQYLCDRVIIMYGGLIMEEGEMDAVFNHPFHPYTKELIECVKSLRDGEDLIYTLEGKPLVPSDFKEECPFYHRCKIKTPDCSRSIPKMIEYKGRKVRCINV